MDWNLDADLEEDFEGDFKGGLQRGFQRGLQRGLQQTLKETCCQAQVRSGQGQIWSRSGSVYCLTLKWDKFLKVIIDCSFKRMPKGG